MARMITGQNVSSIEVMSTELGVSQDDVTSILLKLVEQGTLKGRISDDGLRFFQDNVKVSERPPIPTRDKEPTFLEFNTKPGRYLAEMGLAVVVISYLALLVFQGSIEYENTSIGMLLIGFVLIMAGCYYVGRHKTPP